MRNRIFLVYVLAVVIVVFSCSSAFIYAQQRGQGFRTPFERDDKNSDVKLSREEFRGPSHAFQRMDIDGDGFITRQELREARQGAQQRRAPYQRERQGEQDSKTSGDNRPVTDGPMVYVDTHNHLVGQHGSRFGELDYDEAAEAALEIMNKLGIKKMFIMPPPFPLEHPRKYDYKVLARIVGKKPNRFGFLGGGGTLNPMIQKAIKAGEVTSAMRRKFEEKAEEIIQAGAFGFGEMTAEHLSTNPNHPYLTAPPDHPLFLFLADIAARHNVPIDIHMEAIPEKMSLHGRLGMPPNPPVLTPNIAAFERLLKHNPKAKIIWVHAGWDNTRRRTVALSRVLLGKHPNLYMSIRVVPQNRLVNRPIDSQGHLEKEWLNMIRAFPDRFLIGSDQFHPELHTTKFNPPRSDEPTIAFLSLLPPGLAPKVGYENAKRIFKLNQ